MPLILPGNVGSATGGAFEVANSLRFDDGSSSYLNDTFSTGNRDKWTWSGWVKRNALGANITLFSAWADSDNNSVLTWLDDDAIRYKDKAAGGTQANLYTNRKFRDISAWYHIVLVYDSGNATSGNRIRFYINGVEETSFSTDTMPSQNNDSTVNRGSCAHYIGTDDTSGYFFDGYMAQVAFCDGQAYAATDFGEFDEDSGIWKPKNLSALSYGTTGFLLEFKESGTSQNSSGLGADTSGLNNHFAVNNFAAIDQSTDTCTNNFAIFNSLAYGTGGTAPGTFSEGNLKITYGSASWRTAPATIGLTQGKWYYEAKAGTIAGSGTQKLIQVGAVSESGIYDCIDSYHESTTYSYAYHWSGQKYVNNGAGSFGSAITTGDIVMIALDLDNNYIYAGLNGTWQNSGNPASGGSGTGALSALQSGQTYFPTVSVYNSAHEINFGSPSFSISSGNTDANGIGNFEYSVPSGYFAVCTKNLAEHG